MSGIPVQHHHVALAAGSAPLGSDLATQVGVPIPMWGMGWVDWVWLFLAYFTLFNTGAAVWRLFPHRTKLESEKMSGQSHR
jgi:predicted MFS family arabinose efflux permease